METTSSPHACNLARPPIRPPGQPSPEAVLLDRVFGQPEHAAALLRSVFDRATVARVDWSSLQRDPRTFVDPGLRHLYSDALFTAVVDGGPGFLYLLFERASDGRDYVAHVVRNLDQLLRQWADDHPGEGEPAVLTYVMRLGQQP